MVSQKSYHKVLKFNDCAFEFIYQTPTQYNIILVVVIILRGVFYYGRLS